MAANIAKLHPCDRLPDFFTRDVADPGGKHRVKSADWDVYGSLLAIHPGNRRRLGRGKVDRRPAAPWRRIGGSRIDTDLRLAYALELLKLMEDPRTDPTNALAALTLIDLWLAKCPGQTHVLSCVLAACIHLAQVHTQRYDDALFKEYRARLRKRHGKITPEIMQRRAEEMMGYSLWQPPLGHHVWGKHDWTDVHDMVYRPQLAYTKYK